MKTKRNYSKTKKGQLISKNVNIWINIRKNFKQKKEKLNKMKKNKIHNQILNNLSINVDGGFIILDQKYLYFS